MQLETASFSGHESFPLRNTWLTKGVIHCAEAPDLFSREDEAMVDLGVGKNMVRAIKHWCLACRVLEEDRQANNNRGRRLIPSAIGRKIFLDDGGWDPYLEDVGTLWLIHWLLATNGARATTWYFAFSHVHQPEFTRESLKNSLLELARRFPRLRTNEGTLKRDIDVFIRTYVSPALASDKWLEDSLECPLTELGLIFSQTQRNDRNRYAFARGPKDSLPDAVVVYALWDYASRKPGQRSFTFDELAYGPGSVGRTFKLDEPSLAERLDRLSYLTADAWQFSETAGLKQVVFLQDIDPIQVLADYYS